MDKNNILEEQDLRDIVLCDPITRGGKEALSRLKLSDIIDESYFYQNLHITSKYDEEKTFENEATDDFIDRHCLYYKYTSTKAQFESIQNRLKQFNSRFYSNSPNEYPLLMLGVAGNGKSVEVNWRIFDMNSKQKFKYKSLYFDLESGFTKKTHGVTFECPNKTPTWLFCIKLLEGIFQFIRKNKSLSATIFNNYKNTISKFNFANVKQSSVFNSIKKYGAKNNETPLFRSLINLIDKNDVYRSIRNLLEILMWIQYCSEPNQKHYVIFDNIEQYILLNKSNIQIFDSDLSIIYKAIDEVVTNLTSDFNEIKVNLGWTNFKIIIVLRRTSLGLLDPALLQAPVKGVKNATDITGHFLVSDIWAKKKKHIWDGHMKSLYNSDENESIIEILDILMTDGKQTLGTNYQSLIAPLMSYGIRRNANSQIHSAYMTYKMLSDENKETINYKEFKQLLSIASFDNNAIRYMFRRSLIEFQFKWSISTTSKERWKKLNIGHLTDEKRISFEGNTIKIENVDYENKHYVTLLRRVLSFLSSYAEDDNLNNDINKSVDDMFSTLSLFDLIKGVLINPTGKNVIKDEDYLQLSKVLISLSNMSFSETRCAPYIILSINDTNFHSTPNEITLKKLLIDIYAAGPDKSSPGQEFNCSQFGVRLTEAGYSFLLDWQSSFSFIASLHCFTIPPLFFLKDISSIKYVIQKVYNASYKLCEMYENEAASFCGDEVTLKKGTYLLNHNDRFVTFKERVKELHINHLNLYRNFIERNYKILNISSNDKDKLTSKSSGYISKYIGLYENWKTERGAPECF